jgi:hypothetical protein
MQGLKDDAINEGIGKNGEKGERKLLLRLKTYFANTPER